MNFGFLITVLGRCGHRPLLRSATFNKKVGADESRLPARSVLLLRRGVHRTPAPHISPLQIIHKGETGRCEHRPLLTSLSVKNRKRFFGQIFCNYTAVVVDYEDASAVVIICVIN